MKRGTLIFLLMLFTYGFSFAQLTGIKNIPGDYPSLAAAVADLNVAGVGPGGVTFNISAGYTETFASATSGLITATGTASDPIVFQKAGIGANPVVTAPVGLGSYDYIICVAGGDYITIDGIDIRENPFYNLTFNNCYDGILLYGFNAATPFNFYDQGNEAGKDGFITINGLGWGGAGPDNAIMNASGVVAWYQNALTVSNCSITGPVEPGYKNNGSFFTGIYLGTGTNSSYDIYNNTISVNYTAQGGFQAIYSAMGKSGTGNAVNIYNNNIINNNAQYLR